MGWTKRLRRVGSDRAIYVYPESRRDLIELARDGSVPHRLARRVLGPGPIEVAEWLEATNMRGAEPTLQAAAGALLLLPVEHRRQPWLAHDLGPMGQQPV
jgi:hypothetical protein